MLNNRFQIINPQTEPNRTYFELRLSLVWAISVRFINAITMNNPYDIKMHRS
ncbi:hypothetical protein Hanom_Chr15g01367981 [Helianthus anomalus]